MKFKNNLKMLLLISFPLRLSLAVFVAAALSARIAAVVGKRRHPDKADASDHPDVSGSEVKA
jgi:hypothetical protein